MKENEAVKPRVLKLKTPIIRDDKPVHEISMREPSAGELRGIRLFELTQGDSDRALILVAEMFALDDEDGEAAGKPSPAA